ncbi:MAG TPA: peptidoglycan recognition family protein [Tepidisphaeraceae bacterium]|nr:peptidoglycan recognition family protein [Tepidisphaeraceae bacterium]
MKKSRRKVVVLTSLVAFLTLTSALLLVIAPPPLTAEVYHPLLASDSADNLDAIFQTQTPMRSSRWQFIYIHQSATPSGDATSLAGGSGEEADHFVIGNGDGCPDGEIQMTPRWMKQEAALPPAGAAKLDPNCISICLIGDFDSAAPTPMQMNRVAELVSTLQSRLHLGGDQVIVETQGSGQAGIGRYFPESALREQILP